VCVLFVVVVVVVVVKLLTQLISITGFIIFCNITFLCVDKKSIRLRGKEQSLKGTRQRVEDILKKEKEFVCSPEYIKQKNGVKDYLLYLSTMKYDQYPSYWKRQDTRIRSESVVKEPLDSQSKLYKEVEKMVYDTWEAGKVGHGHDAKGLQHTKLVIKNIFLIENQSHFMMYSAKRKQICMDAAVNQFPSLNGLQGEWEVKTRKLGMSISSVSYAAVSTEY